MSIVATRKSVFKEYSIMIKWGLIHRTSTFVMKNDNDNS